jgi:glycerol-1-phosphate dehydrogenase [NAD(P)+]
MRGVAYGTATEMHGIQAALGTLICIQLYEKLSLCTPNREMAISEVENFPLPQWQNELSDLVGDRAATEMIELEKKEGKYSPELHKERLEIIIRRWDEILEVINDLPKYDELKEFCHGIGLPTSVEEAGLEGSILKKVIGATRDVRDKYVLTRLIFDLGLNKIFEEE